MKKIANNCQIMGDGAPKKMEALIHSWLLWLTSSLDREKCSPTKKKGKELILCGLTFFLTWKVVCSNLLIFYNDLFHTSISWILNSLWSHFSI